MRPDTAHATIFLLATVAGAVGVGYLGSNRGPWPVGRAHRVAVCACIMLLGLVGFVVLALR